MKDGYVQGCALLVLAIVGFTAWLSPREGSDQQPQHPTEQHTTRKHDDRDRCQMPPCVDVPIACFVRGGAPLAPECLHD